MRKRITCLAVVALLLTMAGCTSKEKTCRCSVKGSNITRNSDVRIIKIEKGECEQLHIVYFHTDLDSLKVDTLYCTDEEFNIDNTIEEYYEK